MFFVSASEKAGNTTETLARMLETRLDNAVYRTGFAVSRGIARHIVSHGHIFVNGRRVTIPSYRVRMNDVISLRPESASSPLFSELHQRMQKFDPPAWIELDREKKAARILRLPTEGELDTGRNVRLVVEFYSK
jgi:small subunit ribosomal protein S4